MSPCSSDCIFRAFSALSGIQSLRILESYELTPPHLPEASAAVHRQRHFEQLAEAGERAMVTLSHLPHDAGELLEVRTLRREKGNAFEERNHELQQRTSFSNDIHQRSVSFAIRLDVAATESLPNQLQH